MKPSKGGKMKKEDFGVEKFKVGDDVHWVCKPYHNPLGLWVNGTIVKMVVTTFGACKTKEGAKIAINPGSAYPFKNRRFTTVSLDKLRKD